MDPGWFASFSEGESTYDEDGDAHGRLGTRPDVSREDLSGGNSDRPALWFHESASPGKLQAWQTHSPEASSSVSWEIDNGKWVQSYQRSAATGKPGNEPAKLAEWFDSSIKQYDSFGRIEAPNPDSRRNFIELEERMANTTLKCKASGCTANATMQLFNPEIERAHHCRVSLYLHPTDFDDHYSGERLTFIKVNGATVNTDCFPMVSGCNATTQEPMFPCLQDLQLGDHLVGDTGSFSFSAQISDVVDECAYEGNLLSGVPSVTCLIEPLVAHHVAVPEPARPVLRAVPAGPPWVFASALLACPERGCQADARVLFNHSMAFSKCLLTVTLYQTDFDEEQGATEQVEFVSVDGMTVAEHLKPGKNPCRSIWAGMPLSESDIAFVAVSNHDVTDLVMSNGTVSVAAKISKYVDECAHEGYLLHGRMDVNCTVNRL